MNGLNGTLGLIGIVMVSSLVVSRALRRLVGTIFLVLGIAVLLFGLITSMAGDCRLDIGAEWPQLVCQPKN